MKAPSAQRLDQFADEFSSCGMELATVNQTSHSLLHSNS